MKYFFLKRTFLVYFFIILITNNLFSQSPGDYDFDYSDKVYKQGIKTIEAANYDWELSYPILDLHSDQSLRISFDLIGHEAPDMHYTFIHCNADWKPSDLLFSEYCEGFEDNIINDFSYSINTFQNYVHYQLTFPNDDVKPTISGNFLLVVYQNGNKDNLVFTKQIYISEPLTETTCEIKRALSSTSLAAGQRVDFSVFLNDASLNNEYIKAVVLQNGRTDNKKNNLLPKFYQGNKLIYQDEIENVFVAGNEFRHIDLKSERFKPLGVEKIYYEKPFYHFKLENDLSRNTPNYIAKQDINGNFLIKKEGSDDSYISADYFLVHFSLKFGEIPGGNVFVTGAFCNWNLTEENKMEYNFRDKLYYTKLQMKQGYYNYAYVFKNSKTDELDYTVFEGSFSETENQYLIFIYDTNPSSRYQRLIGAEVFSNEQ